jgi:hypothetical protein
MAFSTNSIVFIIGIIRDNALQIPSKNQTGRCEYLDMY